MIGNPRLIVPFNIAFIMMMLEFNYGDRSGSVDTYAELKRSQSAHLLEVLIVSPLFV